MYINGSPVYMTAFDGVTGEYLVEGSPIIAKYKECVELLRDCPENREGVHEADVSTFKKSTYFDAFISSFSVMHMDYNDATKEASYTTSDKNLAPLDSVRQQVYDTLNALKFEPITKATFADVIVIDSLDKPMTIRNNSISIPNVLLVFKGERDCTQQVNIGDVTVMKYESNNFDFYQYGDNLIKATKGTDVSQYITLKNLE